MRRPCDCNKDTCRMCWHAANSPRYQRLWGITPGVVSCCGPRIKEPDNRGAAVVEELAKTHLPYLAERPIERVITLVGGPVVWACGITTVPEREELLHRTLGSLAVGGFPEPQVFVERGLRAFGTWWHALVELWIRNPHADRYLMLQDDLLVVKNARRYLDKIPHPEKGYWNLFTTRENENLVNGRVGWVEASLAKSVGNTTGQQTGRGALALCFPRQALIELLTSRHLVERPMDRPRDSAFDGEDMCDRSIDGCVVTALNKRGFREYVHAPSLVQHTGDESIVGRVREDQLRKLGKVRPPRVAKSFPGESFDALSWL